MKKFYILFLSLFASYNLFAGTITAVSTGDWSTVSTWDLNRVPAGGDVVVIPTNKTVSITDVQSITTGSLNLDIYGTLVLNNGKISMTTPSVVDVFYGGMLAGSGSPSETLKIGTLTQFTGTQPAVLGQKTSSSSTTGFVSFSPLPVKFSGFDAAVKNNDVVLHWSTSEETDAAYYIVERSNDGDKWKTAGQVKANGTTNNESQYVFTDKNAAAGVAYYRIKQVDLNGRFVYTSIKVVKNTMANINIGAVQNQITIQFAQQVKGSVMMQVVSLSGQVIARQVVNAPSGQVTLNAANAVKGQYIVWVSNNADVNKTQQIVL